MWRSIRERASQVKEGQLLLTHYRSEFPGLDQDIVSGFWFTRLKLPMDQNSCDRVSVNTGIVYGLILRHCMHR